MQFTIYGGIAYTSGPALIPDDSNCPLQSLLERIVDSLHQIPVDLSLRGDLRTNADWHTVKRDLHASYTD